MHKHYEHRYLKYICHLSYTYRYFDYKMNVKIEGILYVLGGILRFIDFITDVWYVYTQTFKEDWIYYVSAASLISPSTILLLVFLFIFISNLCAGEGRQACISLAFGLVSALLTPFGLMMCGFGMYLLLLAEKKREFYIIEGLARTSGFIEGVFESLPQLIVQSYNNIETNNWDLFTITSICLSAGGFLYTYIKLVHALDKMRRYEQKDEHKLEGVVSPCHDHNSEDVFDFMVSPYAGDP